MSGPPCDGEITVSAGQCHPENKNSWQIWALPTGAPTEACAEVYALAVKRTAQELVWRISALYVPPSWRGKGWAGYLIDKALKFIAQNSEGLTPLVFLEAIPYEADDSPPAMDEETLRAFYRRHGFRAFTGHPFCMWQRMEIPLT